MPREMKPGPAFTSHPSSFLSLLSGWVQQGVESFFASQRILLDLVMRQNAIAMKSLRDGLSDPKHSPVEIFTEIAMEGTSSFMEAQRILLTLAQEENEIVMHGLKDRVGGFLPAAAMTDLVRRSIDTFLDMHHEFLTLTGKHTMDWLDAARKGHIADHHMLDLAGKAMNTFIHAQKKFLDVVAQESARMTTGKMEKPRMGKKTEVATLARDAGTAFIEAQKKLLDVAGQQMNVNLKTATRTMEMLNPMRLLPLANMTGEGVRGFVDAEKELIENMVKPPRAVKPMVRHGKRPRGRKMTAAAGAA